MLTGLTQWLENSSLALLMMDNLLAFPIAEVIHVMSITILVGTIIIVDLRLLNLAAKSYPVTGLMRALLPTTVIAFAVAAASGVAMLASQPATYLAVTVFLIKLGLLALAIVNMGIFHLWTQRSIVNWDEADAVPMAARVAGLSSIVLWVAILFAGRFVGFLL